MAAERMKVNTLPAPTWNWLKINDTVLSLDEIFERQKSGVQTKMPDGVSFSSTKSTKKEESENIKTALGENFSGFLAQNQAEENTLRISKNTSLSEPVFLHLDIEKDKASFQNLLIEAEENSQAKIILDFASESEGAGLNAFQTRIRAAKNAKVHFVTLQLLGSGFLHFNDIGVRLESGASVEVTQVELGAKKMFTGVYSALDGDCSNFKSDISYYCCGEQELDMNFVAIQSGKKTNTKMFAAGTLKDRAKKLYRGTIDFKTGCSGADGNEQEETLLLSPEAVNKSIPLILCGEDDISGEHGATIGYLGDDILFYLNSRGIKKSEAEGLMSRAKVMQSADLIGDEATIQKASDFLETQRKI